MLQMTLRMTLRTIAYLCCFAIWSWMATAADFCSLQVNVEDSSGRAQRVLVAVEEETGRRTETWAVNGTARFCDLGIHPVTVFVGRFWCSQVVVRNVPLEWGESRALSVGYDARLCKEEGRPRAECQFLLRFVNENSKPISVRLNASEPFKTELDSDDFGRMFLRIPAHKDLTGLASALGYMPTEVHLPCNSQNLRIERKVVLRTQ